MKSPGSVWHFMLLKMERRSRGEDINVAVMAADVIAAGGGCGDGVLTGFAFS